MFVVIVWRHPIIASYAKEFPDRDDAIAYAQGIVRNDPDRRVTIKNLESGEPVEF